MKIYLSYKERVAGIFLLLAFLLVILFIVGVAIENLWFAPRVSYYTLVNRGEGLHSGSPILLSGIEIGKIGEITIMQDNRIKVELVILEEHSYRLKTETKATVNRLLGIGEKRILLTTPINTGSMLTPNAYIQTDEPQDLLDVISTVDLGRYLSTLDKAVESMDVLLVKLNEDNRMVRMIEAFDQLGPVLQKANYLLGEMSDPFIDLIKDPSLKGTFKGANKVFNDPATIKTMRNMSKSFDPVQIKELMSTISHSLVLLDALLEENGPAVGTLKGLNRLMNDGRLDRILTTVEKLSSSEKIIKLLNNLSVLAEQLAIIGPEIPEMSKELISTMRDLSIVLKALQKTWILDDESEDVLKEMRKKEKRKKED